MTNTITILLYLPLLVIDLLLLGAAIFKREKSQVDKLHVVLCLLITGWLVTELHFYAASDPWLVAYVFSFKFVFAAFVPVVFLFMMAGFYRMDLKLSRLIMAGIFAVPVITALLALTSPWQELFRKDVVVLSTAPITQVQYVWGPWYVVNLISSQLMMVCVVLIFITQVRNLPKPYRGSVHLLVAALAAYVAGIVVEIGLLDGGLSLDFNLIGICLANFIVYMTIASNGRADYLNIWRRDIFDHLDEPVLILSQTGVVMEANSQARRLFDDLCPQLEGANWDQLLRIGAQKGELSVRAVAGEHQSPYSHELYITKGKYPLVYSMVRQTLPTTKRAVGGEFIALSEVTWNRLLIERLRASAGVDTLTGLENRFGYEELLRQWDTPENLPLSVILSDVNHLKELNDTQGHDAGDAMLCQVADTLRQSCPTGGAIARIGGDEFVMLLKNCGEMETQQIVSQLAEAATIPDVLGHRAFMALGSATKNHPSQNISQLIRQADARMYANKHPRKGDA